VEIAAAVEGETDLAALRRVLRDHSLVVPDRLAQVRRGKYQLDRRIPAYNDAARIRPWIVLRDLDNEEDGCAMRLRRRLMTGIIRSPAFCLRVAVRSLESWLLADSESFSTFFSVSRKLVPSDPEALRNPKEELVNVCRRSRRRVVRERVAPGSRTGGGGARVRYLHHRILPGRVEAGRCGGIVSKLAAHDSGG
jgi:hypothetical protein